MLAPQTRIDGSIAQRLLVAAKFVRHVLNAAILLLAFATRLLPAAAFVLLATPALSAWTVVSATGGVFSLVDGKWAELSVGTQVDPDVPVRTLPNGRLELAGGGLTLQVGPESAVELEEVARGLILTQFAGTVAIDANVRAGRSLVVRSPHVTVTLGVGRSRLTVFGDAGRVVMASGSATVSDNVSGVAQEVGAGEDTTPAEVAAASAPGNSAKSSAGGNANANSNAAGNGNSGNGAGNGNGNAGGNGNNGNGGNSGGNGNGGGNGKENGNGKSK